MQNPSGKKEYLNQAEEITSTGKKSYTLPADLEKVRFILDMTIPEVTEFYDISITTYKDWKIGKRYPHERIRDRVAKLIAARLGLQPEAIKWVKPPRKTKKAEEETSATKSRILRQQIELLGKAHSLCRLKRYEEAIQVYNKVLSLDPMYQLVLWEKIDWLLGAGKKEEAIQICDLALSLDPTNKEALRQKFVALDWLKRYEEIIQICDLEISLDPTNIDALLWKTESLYSLKRYKEVIQICDQILSLDPRNKVAFSQKASSLHHLGRYEETLKTLDEAIKIDPEDFYSFFYEKSRVLKELGRYEEAQEAFAKAKELGEAWWCNLVSNSQS